MKNKPKILITGVAGFIGSNLLDALLSKNKYEIVGVDNFSFGNYENIRHQAKNPNFKFYKIDILNFNQLKKAVKKVDIIIHLAAYKKIYENDSAFKLLNNNTLGAKNILDLARIRKAKVIMSSTSDVYGTSTKIPFREDGELMLGPSNVKRWSYAAFKLFDEHLAFAYYEDFKVPVVILRYFGTFGPRMATNWSGGHIPLFTERILQKKPVIIHGNGKQTRSLCYITDNVESIIRAMFKPKAVGQIINVGSDEEVSVIETAYLIHKTICRLTGKKYPLKIKYVPLKKVFGNYKEIMRRVPDLSKCKKILHYQSKIAFEKGLELFVRWYLKERV